MAQTSFLARFNLRRRCTSVSCHAGVGNVRHSRHQQNEDVVPSQAAKSELTKSDDACGPQGTAQDLSPQACTDLAAFVKAYPNTDRSGGEAHCPGLSSILGFVGCLLRMDCWLWSSMFDDVRMPKWRQRQFRTSNNLVHSGYLCDRKVSGSRGGTAWAAVQGQATTEKRCQGMMIANA